MDDTAGVVLDSDGFQENDMKKIAKILGHSETAFVSKSEVADFKKIYYNYLSLLLKVIFLIRRELLLLRWLLIQVKFV